MGGVLSENFLLGVFSFWEACVALHQKLLDGVDAGILVLDVAVKELDEPVLVTVLGVWARLVCWCLPKPSLRLEVGSLIVQASFWILDLLSLLDVWLMCKDTSAARLLRRQRQLLTVILASLGQEEAEPVDLFASIVFRLLCDAARLPCDLVEVAYKVTAGIPDNIAEVPLLLACQGLSQKLALGDLVLLLILVHRLSLSPQCLELCRWQHAGESVCASGILLDTVTSNLVLVALLELLHEVAPVHYQLVDLLLVVDSDGLLAVLVLLHLGLLLELCKLIQLLLHNHLDDETADEPVLLQPLLELRTGHVDLARAHALPALRPIHQQLVLFLDDVVDLLEAVAFDSSRELALGAAGELLLLRQVGLGLALQLRFVSLGVFALLDMWCSEGLVAHGLVLASGLRWQGEV